MGGVGPKEWPKFHGSAGRKIGPQTFLTRDYVPAVTTVKRTVRTRFFFFYLCSRRVQANAADVPCGIVRVTMGSHVFHSSHAFLIVWRSNWPITSYRTYAYRCTSQRRARRRFSVCHLTPFRNVFRRASRQLFFRALGSMSKRTNIMDSRLFWYRGPGFIVIPRLLVIL
jgi:hypothetical protein